MDSFTDPNLSDSPQPLPVVLSSINIKKKESTKPSLKGRSVEQFSASAPNSPIPALHFQETVYQNPYQLVPLSPRQSREQLFRPLGHDDHLNSEDDVSEAFVTYCNTHIGNKKNLEKAARLLEKMRALGGLDPNVDPNEIDIPAARMGLVILASLNDFHLKIAALKSLQEILNADPLTNESANELVSLAKKILYNMNRELLQTEIIETQIEIVKSYGIISSLLLHHYVKKNINGITKELKAQLSNAAGALKDLNRQRDTRLSHLISFAIEGINRLKDDKKELIELLCRFHNFSSAIIVMGGNVDSYDAESVVIANEYIKKAFKGIKLYRKHAWFDAIVFLRELKDKALSDNKILSVMQDVIAKKHKKLSWHFLYEAIDILSQIVISGTTFEIRKNAFKGMDFFENKFPGLLCFLDFSGFSRTFDPSPLVHLERMQIKDRSLAIRSLCMEKLEQIICESPDAEIISKAKEVYSIRAGVDLNPSFPDLRSIRRNSLSVKEVPFTSLERFNEGEDYVHKSYGHGASSSGSKSKGLHSADSLWQKQRKAKVVAPKGRHSLPVNFVANSVFSQDQGLTLNEKSTEDDPLKLFNSPRESGSSEERRNLLSSQRQDSGEGS